MKKQFLYIANWKAYFTFNQSLQWIQKNKQTLAALAKKHSLVICPSFDALNTIAHELQGTEIFLGAQNCSAHNSGAYTGQVLIESLKEIGCHYCFVGHSEVRKEFHETTDTIATKASLLLAHGIIPIICVGESAQDYELDRGAQILEQQLAPILQKIANQKTNTQTILIGYEPLWAIGSGSSANSDYLKKQLETLAQLARQITPTYTALLVYGGGVNDTNIQTFKDNPLLNGVLIGGASTDFQKLEKIVLL